MMEDDYIKKVIFDLMFLGRSSMAKTAEFKQRKHNSDLVPAFNAKLEEIISLFERYHKVSYDIQGIRDNGVDVLLKYEYRSENVNVGLQIKSFDDFEGDAWLSKLKAQVTDAKNCYSLADYYIIFCTDGALHREKIRNATASLSQIEKTYIVTPEQAMHFINLKQHQIGAHIKRKISDEDKVVMSARNCLGGLTLGQSALVIEAAARFIESGEIEFSNKELVDSTFVSAIYESYPNIPSNLYEYDFGSTDMDDEADDEYFDDDEYHNEESLLNGIVAKTFLVDIEGDLQELCEQNHFELVSYAETIKFEHTLFTPMIAVMYEAIARYEYEGIDLRWYTFRLLMDQQIALAEKVIQLKEVTQ